MPRFVLLSILGCFWLAPVAQALTLTPLVDGRYVSSNAQLCAQVGNTVSCTGTGNPATVPSTPFSQFDGTADDPGIGGTFAGSFVAKQDSSIGATSMEGTGSVALSLEDLRYSGNAASAFVISFALDEAALVSFHGDFAFASTAPFSDLSFGGTIFWINVNLCTGGCAPGNPAQTLEDHYLSVDRHVPDAPTAAIVFDRVLAPGQYNFSLSAYGQQMSFLEATNTASYSFDLGVAPVPEPSGAALAAALVALVAARRRALR